MASSGSGSGSSAVRLSMLRSQTESNLRAAITASRDAFKFSSSGYSQAPESEPAQALLPYEAARSTDPVTLTSSPSLLDAYEARKSSSIRTSAYTSACPQRVSSTAALYGAASAYGASASSYGNLAALGPSPSRTAEEREKPQTIDERLSDRYKLKPVAHASMGNGAGPLDGASGGDARSKFVERGKRRDGAGSSPDIETAKASAADAYDDGDAGGGGRPCCGYVCFLLVGLLVGAFVGSRFDVTSITEQVAWFDQPFAEGMDVCEDGLIVAGPLPSPRNTLVWTLLLAWTFVGVAIAAEVFMAAIEVITSQQVMRTITLADGTSKQICVTVWNATVANLTLMALGSSAP